MGISLVEAELPGDIKALEKDLTEAVLGSQQQAAAQKTQRQQPAKTETREVVQDEALPPKLRGKSVQEIAEMYANLESSYGRMANDLGTQRKLTDRLLDLKREEDLSRNTPPSRVEIKSQDLLENPTEVIDRAVQARVKALETESAQRLAQIEGQLAREKFVSKHADYNEIANDPQFVAWLQKSQYRLRAANAAYNGDWAAADELLTDYKEIKKTTSKPRQEEEVIREDDNVAAARQAALESGSSPEAASAKAGKTYRRVDLMKLRTDNPDLYYDEDFQKEIIRAYAEKRVK